MRKKYKNMMAYVLAGILFWMSVSWPTEVLAEEKGVIVTSATELATALAAGNTLITIEGEITVGDVADASGKMLPLEIPANVTLQGSDANATLYCRCPVQIAGDAVTIRDLQLKFLSSNALGSVAHREIFLAGHSLILDNINTYQEGNGGSLGGLGGTEEELLPTVYAGGFEGTTVSGNASLKIQNSNEYTIFQAIYMGHVSGADSKAAYTGKASLYVESKTKVRDGIYVNQNESADIIVSGAEYSNLSSVAFYGNANTKLQIENVSVNNATVDKIGTVIIKDKGYLQLVAGDLNDVSLSSGACLDLNSMTEVTMTGDFAGGVYDGETDNRGVLVMNVEGLLNIEGTVTGSTILHTENRYFTGAYTDSQVYIAAADGNAEASAFVLPEEELEYYELDYDAGEWTAYELGTGEYVPSVIGAVEIVSAPESVDISDIISEDYIPAAGAPYCEVVWKDENGTSYTAEEVGEELFYASDMVIAVRTEYWMCDSYNDRTDWGVPVWFEIKEESPGYYYFYTQSNYEVVSGKYTYLFCNTYFEDLGDMADVKAQMDGKVMAQLDIVLYDSTKGETSSSVTDKQPEEQPEEPAHTHDKGEQHVTPASPGKEGCIKTVCSACGEVLETETITAPKTMTVSKTVYTYNGKLCKPQALIKDTKGVLIDSSNYKVTYANNKKVGTATVIVSFEGKYTGTMKGTFTIRPKKTKITKLTSSAKKIVLNWKKISTQNSGYEIQYSTTKKFTKKTTKTLVINKRKITKSTITKPRAGKKYYVRVRTFKKVKQDGKTKKIYSAWSKVKAAK